MSAQPGAILEQGDTIKIGDTIKVSKSRKTVTIPAWVNQQQGVVEYALVTRAGKTHESIFATDVDARDLHAASLLLGVQPEDIIGQPNITWTVPAKCAALVDVNWTANDKEQKHPLSALTILRDLKSGKPDQKLHGTNWWYNGSRVIEGGAFVAQSGGSIVSLIFDPDALINNPRIDRLDDDIHFVNATLVPPANTPVTIVFSFPSVRIVTASQDTTERGTKPE